MAEPAEVLAHIERTAAELGFAGAIDPEADFQRTLALDSVALLTLVVSLEDRFRVVLREEDTAGVHTPRQLAALVARLSCEEAS